MVGRSWAMIFAGSGYHVSIYDNVSNQVEDGLKEIRSQLEKLQSTGQLRGTLNVEQQMSLIKGTVDLKSCIEGAFYIQVGRIVLSVEKKPFLLTLLSSLSKF